jgi:formylglycine-generating enzyme required for sulfatase activity
MMAQLISQLGQMDDTVDPREKKRLKLRIENMKRILNRRVGLDKNLPVGDIDYFTALSYCRWLSEEQQLESGLPTVEQLRRVYEARTDFQLKQADLDPPGYRLPTASEWEFACRRDSHTLFPFGRSTEFAGRYAWYATNSATRLHPVGQLKPGKSGLFDVLGNTSEWCLDWYHEALPAREGLTEQDVFVDFGAASTLQSPRREYRGGSFADEILDLRSSKRFSLSPTSGLPRVGFRLARTYAPSTKVLSKSDTVKSKKEKGAAKVHQ